jgi:ribosomal peptide maturation radical SAM protein 1
VTVPGRPGRTVLVTMPFLDPDRPSIQVGLLAAIGAARGHDVRTLHANLDFAAQVGLDWYHLLCQRRSRLVGDWLFSLEAFGDTAPDQEDWLLDDFADELGYLGDDAGRVRARLLDTRHRAVPAYLDHLLGEVAWADVDVVGFSSTFQQNTASFALARRLKAAHPQLVTVFGGANFDGDMGRELVRTVDCVDLAVIGEGDEAFPRLLDALAAGTPPETVPGVARRVGDTVVAAPPEPPRRHLDDLPDPDYAEFFERAERLGVLPRQGHRTVWIPFEASRGCWWCEKHHCTFCGLNGTSMAYRSKSADRVAAELAAQARRHRSFLFEAVDNILDVSYLRTLLPALAEQGTGYELFYEVKANLTRSQVRLLAQGGVTRIQPGLESLSSHVLTLMRKGVRAAQNVNLLRWARYYGIDVAWNILRGFPGETAEDYATQAAAVPHLAHLQPPSGVTRVWLERFSPLFTDPDGFAMAWRAPERSYRYVYPSTVDLDRVAYFFEYELAEELPADAYTALTKAVDDWLAAKDATHTFWAAPGYVQIYDGRHPGREGTYAFQGFLAEVYLACVDRPTTAAAIARRIGGDHPADAIAEALAEFAGHGLVFQDGNLAVALALPAVQGR